MAAGGVNAKEAEEQEEEKVASFKLPLRRISSRLLIVDDGEFDLDLNMLPTSEVSEPDEVLIGTHTYKTNFEPKQTLSQL
jgi:hypothetical protein